MISELHFDTHFKIYSSTIGVRNLVRYVPQCQQFNAAIQRKIPTPNLLIKLQLGLIGKDLRQQLGAGIASKEKFDTMKKRISVAEEQMQDLMSAAKSLADEAK